MHFRCTFALLLMLLSATAVASDESTITGQSSKPVWELGVGGGHLDGYDYPASSDRNQRFLALPYFIYRAPRYRLGEGGISAIAIERPRLKLDLSVSGSLNARSEGNSARAGMPDLDYLFELGPRLGLRLFDRKLPYGQLRGRASAEIRAVVATDLSSLEGQGMVAEFGIGVNLYRAFGTGFDLFSGIDTTFASEELHDYLYQVNEEFETTVRPAYDAQGGYLETRLLLGIGFNPASRIRIVLIVANGFYSGTSNEKSPLFEQYRNTTAAIGFIWTLAKSEKTVQVIDLGDAR